MSAILIYSPCPVYAKALTEILGDNSLYVQKRDELAEKLRQAHPALLLIDASHTTEGAKTPAYLADIAALSPEIPVILLVRADTELEIDRQRIFATLTLPLKLWKLREYINQVTLLSSIPLNNKIKFDQLRREIIGNDREGKESYRLALTEKEAAILEYFLREGDTSHSREILLKSLWGYADSVNSRTLETHIYRLRNKLEDLPGGNITITSDDGGYRLITE